MEAEITVSKRAIFPYKTAVKQFESETTTLYFTLDSYKIDQIDLRNYKAFVFTSINGLTDITELPKVVSGNQMTLTWTVSEYTLRYAGAITYQIVFKEDAKASTAVFNTYEAILQCSESVDAERAIQAEYPTIFKQWYDLMQTLAGTFDAGVVYMPVGEPVPLEERLSGRLYYQVENATTNEGHFEDHTGKRIGEFNAKYVANADLDTLLAHGEYICAGTLANAPETNTYCMVRVTDSGSTNRIMQEVYVPDSDGNLRVFMRATTSDGSTFGSWDELISKEYVDAMVGDKDFEIKCLTAFHTNDLTDLYIDTFENTSALSTIPDGYDSRLHQFNITSDCTLVFKAVAISGKSHLWYDIDFETDSFYEPYLEYSFDSGKTWEYMSTATSGFGQIANLTQKTSIMIRIQLSASTTLKNVAFGLK